MQLMQQNVQKSRSTTLPRRSLRVISPDALSHPFPPSSSGGLMRLGKGFAMASWGAPSSAVPALVLESAAGVSETAGWSPVFAFGGLFEFAEGGAAGESDVTKDSNAARLAIAKTLRQLEAIAPGR